MFSQIVAFSCLLVYCEAQVNGNWGSWAVFSECNGCGVGVTQSFTRKCDNPPSSNKGIDCMGSIIKTEVCNCPVNGNWGRWTTYDACTVTCDTGTQRRIRVCDDPAPAYKGSLCTGSSTQTQTCNTLSCPIDGGWTSWSSWVTCSKTCGIGVQTHSRTCTNPIPQFTGADCSGALSETRTCHLIDCPAPPVIEGSDENFKRTNGSDLTIPCRISASSPVTSITWYKDGVALTNGGRYVDGTIASPDLTIHSLVQADTGVYTCSATNAGGTSTGPRNTLLVPYMCPYIDVNDPISQKRYTVPATELGKEYRSPDICLSNGEPLVTLHCQRDEQQGAAWTPLQHNQACNFTGSPTSSITHTLNNISRSEISEKTVTVVVNRTRDVLSEIDDPVGVDIVHVADIVQQIALLDNIRKEEGQTILELVDNITQVNSTVLQESNTIGNATNRIIEAIEDIGDKIVFDNDAHMIRIVSNTTAVDIWDLHKVTGDVVVGLELQQGGQSQPTLVRDDLVSLSENQSPTYNSTETAIFLPPSFIHGVVAASPGQAARLTLFAFADSALFRSGRLETAGSGSKNMDIALNSKVISARITVDGANVTDLSGHVVTTVFLPEVPVESGNTKSLCVFWNPAGLKGQGAWSQDGCRYNSTRDGRVVCVCDHLTNFAVLLDLYGQDALPGAGHQTALSVITIIGLSLSIAGLSVTVLSFLLIKKLRQGRHQMTLFQMALSMLGSWVMFLVGFTRTESHGGCIAVAALLHYLILASFMWMLMEGLLQYLLLVKVVGVSFHYYNVRITIAAWGVPLIPVVTVLAIDPDLYSGGDQYCWMSLTPFYYAFLAPVVVIMLINIVVYVMVIFNVCRSGNIGNSGTNNRTVGVKASFACFVALGLSWVFAFFAISEARLLFQYLFTLTSTPQGFLVFLIFTARDPNVRAYWASLCCRSCRQGAPDHAMLASRSRSSEDPVTGLGGGGRRGRRESEDTVMGLGGGGRRGRRESTDTVLSMV